MLSTRGPRRCIESGVTGDGKEKGAACQLTGKGNRRPEAISDVIRGRGGSSSLRGVYGASPCILGNSLTDVGPRAVSCWRWMEEDPNGCFRGLHGTCQRTVKDTEPHWYWFGVDSN